MHMKFMKFADKQPLKSILPDEPHIIRHGWPEFHKLPVPYSNVTVAQCMQQLTWLHPGIEIFHGGSCMA